ncbi:MAG TPA: Hpt domain-containing protein [Puia sp.]|jgi:HPt (histidine-containing phosphotransfer) domain-containing protein|nr:Hpt domain-containing protein [Puia sp.]
MEKSPSGKFVFNGSLNAVFLDELFEGDTIYAETVFEDFLRDLPGYWKQVEAAYHNRNITELRTSVHTCKTLFGYVGFTDLQEFCQQFEDSCNSRSPEELEKDYEILLQKKEKAQHIIETEYTRLKLFNEENE